jgi:ubiquinol-cytochrome c reductase cytochrome c subunit
MKDAAMTAPRALHLATSALLVAAFLVAAASSANDDTDERDAPPFVSYGCYQCHGYSGHGASSGPRLSADMPYESFQQIVRFPYGVMPAYPRELLSDEDLRAIYSFIEGQPPAPEIKDLPLLYDTSK